MVTVLLSFVVPCDSVTDEGNAVHCNWPVIVLGSNSSCEATLKPSTCTVYWLGSRPVLFVIVKA